MPFSRNESGRASKLARRDKKPEGGPGKGCARS